MGNLHPNRIVSPGMPWKEIELSYLKRLTKDLTNEKDLGVEFLLAWIAVMLTALVILAILGLLA